MAIDPQQMMAMMQAQGQQGGPPNGPPMGQEAPPMGPQGGPPMGGLEGQPQAPQPPMGGMATDGYGNDSGSPDDTAKNYIDYALSEANIAKSLRKKKTKDGANLLEVIGNRVFEGYDIDEHSREEWLNKNREWVRLATLVREEKSFPWPDASNIKFPLVATAAMQFAARAYPALVPADGKLVRVKVVGDDPSGEKHKRANRVARHMSYQVMCKMPNWEEDMDRLLILNPIVGVSFKKTYRKAKEGHCSELVPAQDLCINYWAKDLDSAYRKTEIINYTVNEVKAKVRNGEEFLKEVLEWVESATPPVNDQHSGDLRTDRDDASGIKQPETSDEASPLTFLAQHTFYDLDEDGYEEPYIITIHKDTRKVVRIVARFESDGIYRDSKGDIECIRPLEYFTKFGFIPNPDSNIYDMGFGVLLGGINHAVDTLVNQLVDAGTLNNLQSGFLGKGLRIKQGPVSFTPGEWKVCNATGEEMKNSVIPLPSKEPSPVLFNLLNMLVQSGNQLASVAEIFTGKMPGQNTPATTTQETVEQGMKVFTAIYKRLYRSLYKEFKKLYNLNRINPDIVQEQASVLDMPITVSDYDGPVDDIVPGADPTGDSSATRMMKYQQIMQLLMPLGTINPMVVTQQILEGLEIPIPQGLIAPPSPPPPDPAVQKAQVDMQVKQQDAQLKREMAEAKRAADEQKAIQDQQIAALKLKLQEAEGALSLRLKEEEHKLKMQANTAKLYQDDLKVRQKMAQERALGMNRLAVDRASGEQKLRHQEAALLQKQKQQKESKSNGSDRNNSRGK